MRPRTPRLVATAIAAATAFLMAGCTSTSPTSADSGGATAGGSATARLTGTVTVLAAASLTESFDAVRADLERANPGLTVQISYGSSATLVQQANQGAPADVIALAGEAAAKPLDPSLVRSSEIFAENSLEIAVPPGNPGRVSGLADLARPDLKVVLCETTVPCGAAAATTLAKAKVDAHVVSREIDVKATLAKVSLGEAYAAIVYHSDIVAAKGAVQGIPIPHDVNTLLRYPVIALDDQAPTRAFIDAVLSPSGRRTLEALGFTTP